MKLTSKELKRRARGILTGRYGLPMGAFVLSELIIFLISSPFGLPFPNPTTMQITIWILSTLIISLLTSVLNCGLIHLHLNLARDKEVKLSDLFYFFSRRPDRFILANLLMACIFLLVMLPASLVTIAAFFLINTFAGYIFMAAVWIVTMIFLAIVSISYSQVYYLLIDRTELSIRNAFRESRKIMKGNKARSFYISLSFIGMSLLGVLSFGIGLLWVIPYINQTRTEFYRNLITETI